MRKILDFSEIQTQICFKGSGRTSPVPQR